MNDQQQPSREVIDYFFETYRQPIEELRKAFPAVTLEALTEAVIRMDKRHKDAVKMRRRERQRQRRAALKVRNADWLAEHQQRQRPH